MNFDRKVHPSYNVFFSEFFFCMDQSVVWVAVVDIYENMTLTPTFSTLSAPLSLIEPQTTLIEPTQISPWIPELSTWSRCQIKLRSFTTPATKTIDLCKKRNPKSTDSGPSKGLYLFSRFESIYLIGRIHSDVTSNSIVISPVMLKVLVGLPIRFGLDLSLVWSMKLFNVSR